MFCINILRCNRDIIIDALTIMMLIIKVPFFMLSFLNVLLSGGVVTFLPEIPVVVETLHPAAEA